MNYYDLLGVKPTASIDEIRQAYLAKMHLIHPDKIDEKKDPQSWKEANYLSSIFNNAYAILKDPMKRAEYNASENIISASTTERRTEYNPADNTQKNADTDKADIKSDISSQDKRYRPGSFSDLLKRIRKIFIIIWLIVTLCIISVSTVYLGPDSELGLGAFLIGLACSILMLWGVYWAINDEF